MSLEVMSTDEVSLREIPQWAAAHAPCITFAAVRALAMKQGVTVRDLAAQFQADVERPREVFTRVWDGHWARW